MTQETQSQEIIPGGEINQPPPEAPAPKPPPVADHMGRSKFVTFDVEGRIERAGFGVPPEGAVILGLDEKVADLARLYVDGESGLVPRPELPAPTLEGDDLSVPSGPVGTVLSVVDAVSDEIMWQETTDEALAAHVLTVPDPGRYVVSVEPPFPWLPVQVEFVK